MTVKLKNRDFSFRHYLSYFDESAESIEVYKLSYEWFCFFDAVVNTMNKTEAIQYAKKLGINEDHSHYKLLTTII